MIYIESISYPWSGMSCNHCDVHQGYKLVSHPVLGIWINVTIGFQVHVFFGERPDLGLVLMPYQYRGDISYFFWRQIRQQCFHLWVDDLMKSYEILWISLASTSQNSPQSGLSWDIRGKGRQLRDPDVSCCAGIPPANTHFGQDTSWLIIAIF